MSLPSGFSCPAAHMCLAKSDPETGKITDGKHQEYRCYAAMQEARHTRIRNQRWHNFNLLRRKGRKAIYELLYNSLDSIHTEYEYNHMQTPIVRAHVGGDFFKEDYFQAWMDLANAYTDTQFYSYTKRLDLWVLHMDTIPNNFMLNASFGGKFDHLIGTHNLKFAKVVLKPEDALNNNLQIDHDDSLAYTQNESFAQLIHGTQQAGSEASKALSTLKKEYKWTGYSTNTSGMQEAYNNILRKSNKV